MRAISIVSAVLFTLVTTSATDAAGPAQRSRPAPPTYGSPSRTPGDDIMAIAFAVLMDAAKSAQEDVRAVMASVKAINNAKESLRSVPREVNRLATGPCPGAAALRDCIRNAQRKLMKMELASLDLMRASILASQGNVTLLSDALRHAPEELERIRNQERPPARIIPPNPCRGWNVSFWKQCLALMKAELAGNLLDARSQAQIDAQFDQLGEQLDAMSDLSETTQLRLQMAMDRLSKAMSMLSNMLKKISETQNQIIRNLK
jgi:hypothetical protein